MRLIDADALLKRVQQEEIQALIHDRELSTCFMSPGGTPSTEWWFIEDLIENASTIEPERETGEWLAHKSIFGGLGEMVYTCNKCGYNIGFRKGNYCPICGAKMEVGE